MKLNWKFATTVALAVCTCSLMLLCSAPPCSAQSGTTFKGPYMLADNDSSPTPLANSPEPVPTTLAIARGGDAASTPPALPPAPSPQAAADSDSGWHFAISPYLWLPGVNGTLGALGYETGVHVSPADLVSNVNIGIMALTDIQYNRIIMPIDFMWAKISDSRSIPYNPSVITSAKAKLNEVILTPKIGYRVIDNERLKIDGLVGFRYWHLGTTLTLTPPVAYGVYQAANWVDVVAGARFTAFVTPKIVLTIAGDAGGGGANLDYQVAGVIGYRLKKVILQAGWRYMHVNYRPNSSFILDVNETGLALGVTIPLK
jgi:hypothetical protein